MCVNGEWGVWVRCQSSRPDISAYSVWQQLEVTDGVWLRVKRFVLDAAECVKDAD